MSENLIVPKSEPPVAPKFMFPDLKNEAGGMLVDQENKTFWVGINMKVADYEEASAILDGSKLTALNAYKKLNQKRILQPASSLAAMKNFVMGRK